MMIRTMSLMIVEYDNASREEATSYLRDEQDKVGSNILSVVAFRLDQADHTQGCYNDRTWPANKEKDMDRYTGTDCILS